jgi:glyoxylase-like metal-dependent hydrolase (beta-lactamase superfamily II)
MSGRVSFGVAVLTLALSGAGVATAQDAKTVIDQASKAMGVAGLDSITIVGGGGQGNFGQSRTITFGIASTLYANYTRTYDFVTGTARFTADTTPPTPRGGTPPPRGKLDQFIRADAPWSQQLQIWVTPWGFLRGAAANAATVKTQKIDGTAYKVVTWQPPLKAPSGLPYKVIGYINTDNNIVDKVETWVDHPVVGDEHLEFLYTNYRNFGGVMAPLRMEQKTIGMQTWVATISSVQANPPAADRLGAPPPAPVPPPLPPAASEKLADGVYRITGGYVSMAVEFRDYVVVLEGGQSEARGVAVIAETKRLFPAKKIKYVVVTHPHFDHVSGLGPFMAEGITVLCDDNTKYFIEAAFGTPRTLVGDLLAKSKKKPKVEGVVEKMVLDDGTQRLELYHVDGLDHSDSMLIAYLPTVKTLFTADFRPAGEQPDPSLVTLRENLDRLHLDVDRVVMVHAPNPDRPLPMTDFLRPAKGTN